MEQTYLMALNAMREKNNKLKEENNRQYSIIINLEKELAINFVDTEVKVKRGRPKKN